MNQIITIIISAFALAISIISAFFSFRLQKLDSQRSTREQLNEAINELIKLNVENNCMWYIPQDQRDHSYYQRQGSIGQTAVVITRQALYLAEQHPDLVTDIEYYTIAQGLVMAGDYMLADEYWQKAIEVSHSPFYKVTNSRMYADFLFNQGKHEAGRDLYQKALKLLNNDIDYNKFVNGTTHQMWMVSEANHRFWEEADINYSKAEHLFDSISNPYAKENGLAGLVKAREGSYKLRNDKTVQTKNLAQTQNMHNPPPDIPPE